MKRKGITKGRAPARSTKRTASISGGLEARITKATRVAPHPVRNLRDDGIRAAFLAEYGDDLRHVLGIGWYHFDGRDWFLVPAHSNAVGVLMEYKAARFDGEAAVAKKAGNSDLAKSLARAAAELSGVRTQPRHMASAAMDPKVSVELASLDRDLDLAGCMGGVVVDTRTGIARATVREDLITRRFNVSYDARAKCPRWEAFLLEVMGGDVDLVEFLQRWFGYCLTGHTKDHHFVLFNGPTGRNGKGTILRVLAALFGALHHAAEFCTFAKQPRTGGNAARDDLMGLAGPRLVTVSEPPRGEAIDDALMRKLTGEDEMTARSIFKSPITFTPRAKFIIATNDLPSIQNASIGFRSRPLVIPFGMQFTDERQDQDLTAKLIDELPGIFSWMVRGAMQWHREGLAVPEAIRLANQAYFDDNDPIVTFLEECCELGPQLKVSSHALRAAYHSWCQMNRVVPLSNVHFGRRLGERHVKASGQNHRGVTLKGVVLGSTQDVGDAALAPASPAGL